MLSRRVKIQSPSLEILKNKLTTLMGDGVSFTEDHPSFRERTDVVFFGNILDLLLRTDQFYEGEKVRLWALSRTHARLVESFLNLEKDSISVLSRYKLYPVLKKSDHFNPKRAVDLIYSGRIVAGKNVEKVIEFAHVVRNILNQDITVHLAYPQADDGLKRVRQLALDYSIDLLDHGNLGVDWLDKIQAENPLVVNFSTYAFEDYNVAIAQAQERGFPLIVSQWGAFFDVFGPGTFSLTFDCISNPSEHTEQIKEALVNLNAGIMEKNVEVEGQLLMGDDLLKRCKRAREVYFMNSEVNRLKLRRLMTFALGTCPD